MAYTYGDFVKYETILRPMRDAVESDYPRIEPKRAFKDPEYFNRSVEFVNYIVKKYVMEDVMRTHEMLWNSLYPKPVKIIYNPPATIVFWTDGTKTVVKCSAEDEYNEYYGFLCALGKKIFGTNSHLKKLIDEKAERHYPEDEFSKQIEQLEKSMDYIGKEFVFKTEE